LGKTPTLAAAAYRHRIGRPFNLPPTDKDAVGDDPLSYTRNFLVMLDKLGEEKHRPHPELVRALDQMFILHAEHEMNCSTAALRHIASSRVDPYSAIAGAAAACYGPLHGGANEAVLRMLERDIGSVEGVGPFLARVKARQAKLMGFGHRVYRSYDPRAQAMGGIARRVFAVCFGGTEDRLWQVAQALERAALEDDYFVSRRLYPNVDFYSGLIYRAMGFPTDYFPLLFVVPRVAGWLAHWREGLRGQGEEAKIFRPRAIYVGVAPRPYLDVQCRGDSIGGKDAVGDGDLLRTRSHPFNRRYLLASKY
jgi:citrate synthase